MTAFSTFFTPYFQLSNVAAWGISQNLEGLGLFKYINDQLIEINGTTQFILNLDPANGVAIVTLALTIILAITFLLNIRACFYLGVKAGIVGTLIWVMPGMLALCGVLVDIRAFGPDVFRFNAGFPGGVECAAANLLIFLVLGWSVVMLVGVHWKRDRFKNVYDHIWYPLGLVAALYFVVDASTAFYRIDIEDVRQRKVQALDLYSESTKNLVLACSENDAVRKSGKKLCIFANHLKSEIYTDLNFTKNKKMSAPSWVDKLENDSDLTREIQYLNDWACNSINLAARCIKFSDNVLVNAADSGKDFLFPPTRYAAALGKYYSSGVRTDEKVDEIERGRNIRFFTFMAVAFLAGGKVANASRALLTKDIVQSKAWSAIVVKFIFNFIKRVFAKLFRISLHMAYVARGWIVRVNFSWLKFRKK